MNKKIFTINTFFLFLITVLLISCSNKNKIESNLHYKNTLKYKIDERFNSVDWTKEIEKDRLTANISKLDTINNNIPLTPIVVLNSKYGQTAKPIYPYIEGFGSLDLSNLTKEQRNILDNFCNAIKSQENADSYMETSSKYELYLFINDLKENWESTFNTKFPYPTEEQAETNTTNTTNTTKKIPTLFDSFFYGEPFQLNQYCELPVRFIFDKGFVDVMISLIQTESVWKINQLKILKMGI